ncbi:MAG: DUF3801 domain-containing protein, partial [Abditibacteriota bacterium]|nr:DUF3801 domain-containing protein [Abditibacteriota bacterium]
MNVGGGEAADQLVRMMLTGSEEIIKLSGSLLKNLLAITIAAAKHNKKISGKVNLAKMLRETRDVRYFNMTPETYEKFKKMAKKQGLLFSAIKDKDDRGALVEVVLPATELDRANLIFERLGYDQAAEMSAEREVQPTLRAKVKQAFQKVKTKVKEKLHIKDVSENERTPLGKRIKFLLTLAKEKIKARLGIKDRDVEAEETGTPDRETGGPDREGGDEPDRDFASTERDAESPDRESGTPERDGSAPEEMPVPGEGQQDPFAVPEGREDTPPDREIGTPETIGPEAAAPEREGGTPERKPG